MSPITHTEKFYNKAINSLYNRIDKADNSILTDHNRIMERTKLLTRFENEKGDLMYLITIGDKSLKADIKETLRKRLDDVSEKLQEKYNNLPTMGISALERSRTDTEPRGNLHQYFYTPPPTKGGNPRKSRRRTGFRKSKTAKRRVNRVKITI